MNGVNFWGFRGHKPMDVLINLAHQDQAKILDIAHEAWELEKTKTIINISSRAAQPNISKGYMYASEKAQLNHLANNYQYNSKKRYKMTNLNLGLLNDENLPSVKHQDVAGFIYKLITSYPDYEIADVTLQAHANYQDVQSDKETLKDVYYHLHTDSVINNTMTEYNDFGFTAMDADELAAIDTKIIEKTTTATDVINKLDNFVRPLLENLAKDSDKDYIYWPNRVDIINKKLKELDEIQKSL